MRLLILGNASRYLVHSLISEQLALGFQEAGCDVTLYDPFVRKEAPLPLDSKSFDWVLSCNGAASIVPDKESTLFEELGIPQMVLLTDSPIECLVRLRPHISKRWLFCIDPAHIPSARAAVLPQNAVDFLPQAAFEGEEPSEERSIDLLMTGSYRPLSGGLEALERQRPDLPICERVRAADGEESPHSLALVEELLGHQIDLEDEVACAMVREADLFIRSYRREEMLRLLVDAGLNVTVVGQGWEQWSYRDQIEVRAPLVAKEALALMGRARLVFDPPLLFQYGAHERGLSGMAMGAVGVVPDNPFFRDHFNCEKELLTYSWLGRDDLPEKINALVADEKSRFDVGESGRQQVLCHHTWRERARQIFEWESEFEGFCGP